ncbi:hypothetical protein [Pseudonocardia sp. H11422]|uniref:hypothetical protein n=1 Tax=Pseudonocardia sp. H11422 TaxID=2835866 RepID=UPI001BDD6290|nr:hypothetical protein [Pseudonocardia sp. H11422]
MSTHPDDLAPIHVPGRNGSQGVTITVADQRRQLADEQRRAEEAERQRARSARLAAEKAAAEDAERARRAAERDALDELPVDDAEIDADEEVATLEERIASGDESVTEAALTKARTAAAGRVRFAKLRAKAAERRARRDAEQLEREQAAAAIEHARAALAGYTDADLVPVFDEAARAVAALVEAAQGRNSELYRLVLLPAAERVRGVVTANLTPTSAVVPMPEGPVAPVDVVGLVEAALAAGGIVRSQRTGRPLAVRPAETPTGRIEPAPEPAVIARGRALLGGDAS